MTCCPSSRVALALCCVALAAGCGPQEPADTQRTEGTDLSEPVRFTEYGAFYRDATWSPDGEWIAYASGPGVGHTDIFVRPVAGGEARQLTDDAASNAYPAWSPDGHWICFTSDRDGTGNVWVVSPDSGKLRQVTAGTDSVSMLGARGSIVCWSPDSRSLAFGSTRGGNVDIWVIPRVGGTARRVTTHPSEDRHPSWSPDGQTIAFASDRGGHSSLWAIPVAGGPATQLTSHPADDYCPSWSPDGTWIAFQSNRGGDIDLWATPAEGGPTVRLTDVQGGFAVVPRWSSDGQRIVYNGGAQTGELWAATVADGSSRRLAQDIDASSWTGGADWSPDGSRVAFSVTGREGRDLYTMPAAGGPWTRLTEGGMMAPEYGGVSWSPAGTTIAFASRQSGQRQLWTIPADGGNPRQITVAEGAALMCWSPDGRRIAFTTREDASSAYVAVVPAAGGLVQKLVDWPTSEYCPAWSPDGVYIAFTSDARPGAGGATGGSPGGGTRRGQPGIWIIPASGGAAVRLCDGQVPGWSPDGQWITGVSSSGDIWLWPVAGGEGRPLLVTPEFEFWPRWSPDGREVLFTRAANYSTIWIVEVGHLLRPH